MTLRGDGYACATCVECFPIVAGIPDFRLAPDPYIGIDDDRRKAERLFAHGSGAGFEALLRHYYAVTPEDPPDLAARWIPRALAEVEIARGLLAEHGWLRPRGTSGSALLDVGCSTGGLLIAARGAFAALTGVDVALRWLAVGRVRLREAGVAASLVCANAEHLPFADASFTAVTSTDTIEHLADAPAALAEMQRVSAAGTRLLATANNRFAPLPEPNIHLWGVPHLPRRWQAGYVRWRRGDLHEYAIRLHSARELRALASAAGFVDVGVRPGGVAAPQASPRVRHLLAAYDRLRRVAVIAPILALAGPKLVLTAEAGTSTPPSPSAAAPDDR